MRICTAVLDASLTPRNPTTRTRRSKGKSRSGCLVCKARRVKCDELRPACSRCKVHSDRCTYSTNNKPKWNSRIITFPLSSTVTAEAKVTRGEYQSEAAHPSGAHRETSLTATAVPHIFGNQIVPRMSECDQVLDTQDVFLMMQFTSTTSIDLLGDPGLWSQDAIQLAFQHKFLMHAILAIAARHLQEAPRTSENQSYHDYKTREAHHLQEALSKFSCTFNNNIHANQDAVLATSFLLFFHVSSVITVNSSPTQPCEDASFAFLRGIQSVVADGSHIAHSGRYRSLVAPPILLPETLLQAEGCTEPYMLFLGLINSLPPKSPYLQRRDIYIERFESLMLHVSTCTVQDLKATSLEELLLSLLRWQALCPPVFIELGRSHDPIALIILAHYWAAIGSVVWQAKDKWWWLQRKPLHMVQTIGEYIGPAWAAWLTWPRVAVQGHETNLCDAAL